MSKKSRARAPTKAVSLPPGPNSFLVRWGILLAGGIIVLAALAAYHNSFSVPFIADDHDGIVDNPTIRHWGSALFPPSDTTTGGRPLLNLTFALNYALGGMNTWGYHAFNLLVHMLAGLTLFGIVRRTLLERPTPNIQHPTSKSNHVLQQLSPTDATLLALAVAVIWVVHPLLTQTVTFISERAESLMGLFYLLTLYCFIRGADGRCQVSSSFAKATEDRGVRYQEKESERRYPIPDSGQSPPAARRLPPAAWLVASSFFCLMGALTKEIIVTAPVMVLLYDRTFAAGSFREAWRLRWRYYLGLACSWLLLAHLMAGLNQRGAGFAEGVSWWKYGLTSCRSVVVYLKLSVWPHPLVFDYGTAAIIVRHAAEIVPQALVLAVLLAATAIALWRWPAIGFAGAWFFVILAPASSVVPVAFQPMAEYRAYLSSAAIIALVVTGLYAWIGRRSLILFAAMAVGLGWLCVQRNEDYRSEQALLRDTLAKCPDNSRAHNNLGLILTHMAGHEAEAMTEFETAVKLDPDSAGNHNELGSALADIPSRLPEAIAEYQAALRIKPDSAEVHNNLGMALQEMGNASAAEAEYKAALKIRPMYTWAHNNLGTLLADIPGRRPEAISEYDAALKIDPDMYVARCNLGTSLSQQGNYAAARAQFDEALKLHPDYADGHVELGVMLARMGRLDDAIAQFETALQIQPGNSSAQTDLELVQDMRQKSRSMDSNETPAH